MLSECIKRPCISGAHCAQNEESLLSKLFRSVYEYKIRVVAASHALEKMIAEFDSSTRAVAKSTMEDDCTEPYIACRLNASHSG